MTTQDMRAALGNLLSASRRVVQVDDNNELDQHHIEVLREANAAALATLSAQPAEPAQQEAPTRPQRLRDAGFTRRPTLREFPSDAGPAVPAHPDEIFDSPETGWPSRIINGRHVPCAHDGRVDESELEASVGVVPDLRELIEGAQKHIGHGADLVKRLYNGERPTDTVLGDWMQYAMTYMQIAFQTPGEKGAPPISNAQWFAAWKAAQTAPPERQALSDEQIAEAWKAWPRTAITSSARALHFVWFAEALGITKEGGKPWG